MKIGLALSGGGFRATLFHLGLIRFLYEAGLLSHVTHITSVSGGSIIAAHLGLNWDRYTGTVEEFQAAASELIAFIRLDVRNRIVRRYPLAFPVRGARRLAGLSNRQLTRPGLLEYHYEKYLYGDTSLFQLPKSPCLHLLATNVSEGRLCAFNRDGLWMIRRGGGHAVRMDHVPIGLATVPMAVAASSAFPGFFPPMLLTGADVGAKGGEFGRQAYTDGGVFDNLGVRMFRCLAASDPEQFSWDGVLVSDAGRPFEVRNARRAGGMIRTAMRASDILMDRVWQLETETFRDTAGFAFARITAVVDQAEDPSALHPEVQRQLPNIRTDLDRFSHAEINALVRHGYCVGRKTCRAFPELFGKELKGGPAWNVNGQDDRRLVAAEAPRTALVQVAEPTERAWPSSVSSGLQLRYALAPHYNRAVRALNRFFSRESTGSHPKREPIDATLRARMLHGSASRRIWSTLLDHRDWVSYIYVPIIVPILFLTPYLAFKAYEQAHRINQIVESLAQQSRDLEQMSRLMKGPVPPFVGVKPERMHSYGKNDGFTILQDLRVIDLRRWTPEASGDPRSGSNVYGYRRLKVRKEPENMSNYFRTSVLAISPNTQVRFPAQQLMPTLYSEPLVVPGRTERLSRFEIGVGFQKVPVGESVDVIYEHSSPGLFLQSGIESTALVFNVEAETIELSRWLLLPKGREYRSLSLVRYPTGNPGAVETVNPVSSFRAKDNTILAFKLLALHQGYTYELTWQYE